MDVLFRGATVYDGSGAAGRQTDVAIHGDRVVALGGDAASVLGAVPRVVDAGGLALAPGFIDLHSHADHTLPAFPRATNSLSQGVTTELVGLCGFSPAPVAPERERADALRSLVHGLGPDLDWSWQAFGAFLDRMAAARPAVNVAALVGHHALRIAAMGMADRAPRADELAAMRVELQTALDAGAWGMSTGLVYAPGAFAATDELVSIGEPLTRADALYVSHIRDEGDDLFQAVDEALEIGDRLGIRTQISHLKALGRRNAGKVAGAVERLQAGRTRGVRVHCDVYPYTAGSTFLHQLPPPWIKEGGLEQMVERLGAADQRLRVRHDVEHGVPGWTSYLDATGGWHNILVASVASPERRQAESRRLDDLANEARLDPLEYALDLLVADRGATVMIAFSMDEADVREALRCPVAAIGSDQLGVTSPGARVHPRAYGTFARVLGWGVREAQLFELEQAIHRMTGRPASILGLTDRGRVAPGAVADLVLFDPATIADQATYEDPTRPARGVEHVLVGGEPAVEAGRIVRADLGRVLRRGADNGR